MTKTITTIPNTKNTPNLRELALSWQSGNQIETLTAIECVAEQELSKLYSHTGAYIWASDSPNFKYAFFGRDTATIVENLAGSISHQEQCCMWLVTLAQYQGQTTNNKTDERRGAFPHEIRSLFMDGLEVDQNAKVLFDTLKPRWSDNLETDTIIYYGELDGPARFIRACAALADNGIDLSKVVFTHMSGEKRSLLDACDLATVFIQDRRDESDIDLVELQPPKNLETLTNQTLKDSKPAYLHNNNGIPVLANRSGPRAPLEAQLLSYEALLDYADLVDRSNPNKADFLRKSAYTLKDNVLKRFVVRKSDTNAMWPQTFLVAMLDRNPENGTLRQLNTRMSDAAEGLKGRFFKGDEPAIVELRQAITRTITSGDFLTDGGIRCRALSDHGVFDFAEYHGAFANWIVLTHTVAKGQLAQGYARVATELWTRMLCAILVSGTFKEFFYFDEQGKLLLPESQDHSKADLILRAEEHSQDNQAWSISATLEAISIMKNGRLNVVSPADHEFEDEILCTMPQYRNQPHVLIEKLKQNSQVYRLEKVAQLAGAHEVDLNKISNDARIIRPVLL